MKLEDYIDVVDPYMEFYGDMRVADGEKQGHFTFGRVVLNKEFVIVRRADLARLIKECKR